ncbi:hypothetical protein HY415_02390 [Candidatus Kaiserbacteria bacterium]|nr:hypothetical protein [Candidatus Kaiserbacteria bacterium]
MRPYLPLVLTFLLPLASLAQPFGGLGGAGPSFTLSVDPQYPAPFSTASVSVQSDTLDLANALMSVSVGGSKVYQGNAQPTAITLGRAGSVTRVDVVITTGGVDYTQTLSIRPQDVSLAIEPVSSAPPLYPGKPLTPIEGSVRVVAVANLRNTSGGAIDPTKLSYAWTIDDAKIATASGIGKSAVIVESPLQYRARSVSVAVTSQDGNLVGGDSLSLSPQEPLLRIYENDPLLGIRFERALSGGYSILGAESSLYGAPFSVPTTNGAPFLQWFLNGAVVQTGNSITLRPTGTGRGNASLSFTASSGGSTVASANLSLFFGL